MVKHAADEIHAQRACDEYYNPVWFTVQNGLVPILHILTLHMKYTVEVVPLHTNTGIVSVVSD